MRTRQIVNRETPVRGARSERNEFVHRVPNHLDFWLTHSIALGGVLKLKEITYALFADLSRTLTVD